MLIYLLALLFFSQARAELPPSLCSVPECHGRMAEISAAFDASKGITSLPLVASGECYHLTPDYDSETTHYGVVLLDMQGPEVFMEGRFGFFFAENPYQNWDLEKARAENPGRFSPNHHLEMHDDYSFSDMNPGGEPYRYWLRQSENKIYLEGIWGESHALFCELHSQ